MREARCIEVQARLHLAMEQVLKEYLDLSEAERARAVVSASANVTKEILCEAIRDEQDDEERSQ